MADINKNKKGYRIEKMCEDELKEQGYKTWKTIRHRFLRIDLFGLFDVVGLAADGSHLRFIQCKSGYCPNEVKNKIRELKMPSVCKKEVWMYFDARKTGGKRHGWTKEIIE